MEKSYVLERINFQIKLQRDYVSWKKRDLEFFCTSYKEELRSIEQEFHQLSVNQLALLIQIHKDIESDQRPENINASLDRYRTNNIQQRLLFVPLSEAELYHTAVRQIIVEEPLALDDPAYGPELLSKPDSSSVVTLAPSPQVKPKTTPEEKRLRHRDCMRRKRAADRQATEDLELKVDELTAEHRALSRELKEARIEKAKCLLLFKPVVNVPDPSWGPSQSQLVMK